MKRLALITACTALAACKTQIRTDLFTSDLIAATEGETVTAPLVIGIESISENECKEDAPATLAALRTEFGEAEFIGCESVEFDDFARFRVQVEVLALADDASTTDDAFAIGVLADGKSYHVIYLTNPAATRAIWDALPEDMTRFRAYNLEPLLSAVLNNDLRAPVSITKDDVFADGIPVQFARDDLPRRGKVELQMSDVTNAAFGTTSNASHIVTFTLSE